MKRSLLVTAVASFFILAACNKTTDASKESRWLVIYKYDVAPGNEVVWLTRTGTANSKDLKDQSSALEYLSKHCDALRKAFEQEDPVDYFCSTVVFPGHEPRMIDYK
jgi:hypothetical protein